jgi:hypothetical protein
MVIQVRRRVCQFSRSQQVQCWDKLHLHYICHCMQCRSFIFIWFPIFPIVVLRGHISPRLCSWSQCEGTRKTLRQAYRGSLSLYLGFMLISLCFTSFYRISNPLVPQTRFSPLSLQFSRMLCSLCFIVSCKASTLQAALQVVLSAFDRFVRPRKECFPPKRSSMSSDMTKTNGITERIQ